MHINLTSTLDEYVLAKVKSGRYNNASEVVREALRRMQDEEVKQASFMPNLTSTEIEEIRRSVQQGIDEIERGEGAEYQGEAGLRKFFQEVRSQGLKELSAERRKRAKR
jgi:antitoxin ParD1/3/4